MINRTLPGEPSEAPEGGFQPLTSTLCRMLKRYFPVHSFRKNITFPKLLQEKVEKFAKRAI
jgi:hypothetical protein